MDTIKNIPYVEAKFDKNGQATNSVSIPSGTTDLFVMAHGWRNDEAEATKLYVDFFTNFADPQIVAPARLEGHQCAIAGVFWPSKNFDALIAAQGAGTASNAAAIGEAASDHWLVAGSKITASAKLPEPNCQPSTKRTR